MNNLQLGYQAHQSGQLEQAKQHYALHLSIHPNDPNASQLLGLVCSSLGDSNNAIAYMQRSLSINSAQPHALNNLAVCQKSIAKYADAKANFIEAIKQKHDYIDPYTNIIRLLLDTNEHQEAKHYIDKAQEVFKNNAAISNLNADYCQIIEDYSAAIEICEALLKAEPNSINAKHKLALNLRMAGESKRALELYNQLEQSGVSLFQLFHNKANALTDLGLLAESVEYYKRAISLNPAYLDSHINLNKILWELGDNNTFLNSYREAFTTVRDKPELHYSYASMLLKIRQYESSFNFLNDLPSEHKSNYQYYDLLGRSLKGLGRNDDAMSAHSRAHNFENASINASLNYATALLESQQYQQATEILEAVLRIEPNNQYAWAYLSIAWRMLNDTREKLLNDYDNLVHEYQINVPDGFENIEDFCKHLDEYLASLHTANRQPLEQTLMGGTQSRGNLFIDQNPLIQSLIREIERCIEDYIDKTSKFTNTLPAIRTANDFEFSGSWSVRLKNQGRHTPHVHPMGWLSSAFYVQLPESINDDKAR